MLPEHVFGCHGDNERYLSGMLDHYRVLVKELYTTYTRHTNPQDVYIANHNQYVNVTKK